MEAHRTGMLDRIVAGHDHVHPRLSYYDDAARTAMALRCHTAHTRDEDGKRPSDYATQNEAIRHSEAYERLKNRAESA